MFLVKIIFWQNANNPTRLAFTYPVRLLCRLLFQECFLQDVRYNLWEIRLNEGGVVGYVNWMKAKFPANWGVQIAGMIFQTHSNINLTFWIFSNVISVKITVVKIVIKINSRCHKTLSATSTIRYNITLYYDFGKYVSLFFKFWFCFCIQRQLPKHSPLGMK